MMIFGKQMELRVQSCQKNNREPEVSDEYVNMYVRLRNRCPAKCKFCEFTTCEEHFDFEKFEKVLKEISSKTRINKISFTGGEPTMNLELLERCLVKANEIIPNTFVIINTNGTGTLHALLKFEKYLNSIALSRHHYDDERNQKIFGCNVPLMSDIKSFQEKVNNKNLLHISCNLMKDEIGNKNELQKFLAHCAEMDTLDVGFVALMKVNDFCKEQHVDFTDVIKTDKNIIRNIVWNNGNDCRCANYLYSDDETARIVKFYARYYCNTNSNAGTIVYDGQFLKQGFNGQIIY